MPLITNNFNVVGFLAQPDGITPVPGDVNIVIQNDGAVSNNNTQSTVHGPVTNGQFTVGLNNLVPTPTNAAATGDTLTIQFININTNKALPLQIGGNVSFSITVTLTDAEIGAINTNPLQGQLEVLAVLDIQANIHSDDVIFRGQVLQPDGVSLPPPGLEVFVENLTQNYAFAIPVPSQTLLNGSFAQHVTLGLNSGDLLRYTVRNQQTGLPQNLNVGGSIRPYLSRALTPTELTSISTRPNTGEIVVFFELNENFVGALLPPQNVFVQAHDDSVEISWNNVFGPNIAGFAVYRSLTPSGPFFKISGTNPIQETEYVDQHVFDGVPFYYRVTTVRIDHTDQTESPPSVIKQATPVMDDPGFSVRQFITTVNNSTQNNLYVASRTATISFAVMKLSLGTATLTASLRYRTFTGAMHTVILTEANILDANNNSFFIFTVATPIDAAAQQLVDIRFTQTANSAFIVDNVSLELSGNTSDPTALQIIAPSYNSDNSIVAFKNKLPGLLYFLNVKTGNLVADFLWNTWCTAPTATIAATDDPVEFCENDQTVIYSCFDGLDHNGNVLSNLVAITFAGDPHISAAGNSFVIANSNQGFYPKPWVNPAACNHGVTVVYLLKNTDGSRAVQSVALRNGTTPVVIVDGAGSAGATSMDLDPNGNIIMSTANAILMSSINGIQDKQILNQGSDLVTWGNTNFVPGLLVAYTVPGTTDINTVSIVTDDSPRAEYLLDTTLFPDGLLNVAITATDMAVVPNPHTVNITAIVNNTSAISPMVATAITDPTAAKSATTGASTTSTTTSTSSGPLVGGITNRCALMAAGISSANNGVLQFYNRDTNQLLTTIKDVFKADPTVTTARTLTAPAPIKMRFTWQTDLVTSEPGGQLNPCIMTVDTGGVVQNIFLPSIAASANNPLTIYVGVDGSTYEDAQFKCVLRQAITGPLITTAPELDPLPQFTNGAGVNLRWCLQPGAPIGEILQYVILRSTDVNGSYDTIYTSADNAINSFTDTNIINGTLYFYKIQAIDILGNIVSGSLVSFTVIDRTGALQKLGFIQVDLNIEDVVINNQPLLEPGTGKTFSAKTTFSLNPSINASTPPLNSQSSLFADFTYQQPKDILLGIQPTENVGIVTGDVSGAFVQNRDFIYIKDDNILSGSWLASDKIVFIRQQRQAIEEQVVRGAGAHSEDALGHLFSQSIDSISIPITINREPCTPVSGFLIQLTNTEPGTQVEGKTQTILQITEVINVTQSVSYQTDNIVPIYSTNPTLLQLNIFLNMTRNPPPNPTDKLEITYQYIKIYPSTSYQLNQANNTVLWQGTDPSQPAATQRYLVTYHYLAPVPNERLTLTYTTNALVRLLQFGDVNTGFRGINDKRHICADVLARETTPVPVDIAMLVRLYDTADQGFTSNQITNTVSSLFSNKLLGQGMRISDVACAVNVIPEVESVQLDPFKQMGRTDIPTWLRIFAEDTQNFSVQPGNIEGVVTFFTPQKPTTDVVIPSGTIVSNAFNFQNLVLLFQTTKTITVTLATIDTTFNPLKNRYEFTNVPVQALFQGAATVTRNTLNTIGGVLSNSLQVENDDIIQGAVQRQEVITGSGSFNLTPNNGQLLQVLSCQNFTAAYVQEIPANSNFIKLDRFPITNNRGDAVGALGNTSLIIDDIVVFAVEVGQAPANPGEFFVNYQQGYIQTFTKTPSNENGQQIRYTYQEIYNVTNAAISSDGSFFTLNGPLNSGKPAPKQGDYILVDYRWSGNGVPLKYRIETFSNSTGVLDLSFLEASSFKGPILINDSTEQIGNIATNPQPPFYAYNKSNSQLSIVGRPIDMNEEVIFQFSTPFGDMNVAMTTFNLQTRNDISRFTFNLDFQSLQIDLVEYLQMGATSVQESPGMMINGGNTITNEQQIVVSFAAVDAKDMVLSSDILFRDKTDLDYVPFSKTQLFILPPGNGLKTVYARIRFANTGIQPVALNATITLDTNSNIGTFVELNSTDVLYDQTEGLLKIPTSFGQSDININDLESVILNSFNLTVDPQRVKRTF